MSQSLFRAYFKDIEMALPRPVLKTFIHKLLASNYRLTWRHDEDGIELVIHTTDEEIHIPMLLENEKNTIVNVKELEVTTEELALTLEDLMTDCEGSGIVRTSGAGMHCVSYYDHGKIVSVLRTEGGVDMSSSGSLKSKHKHKGVDPSVEQFVVNGEIDYYLMELKEAIDKGDRQRVNTLKHLLSDLVKNKNNIKNKVQSSLY
ncbi:hypothetical protein MM221_02050 [Salipaludibacillus sp. LMS25]|jgi:hypothetical protein|uniref:hypothetical protein n=1 Tax=Salipaludibacillus sp. LMS25 TaxID=2924031 RepID=UPI0020D1EC19|nr:hypothetical protein [Salipaludibacillus sp. LMS25]UTR15398.1 hypothetical protein MM221_02050 [Salipaludibacillus sp. LMS25]